MNNYSNESDQVFRYVMNGMQILLRVTGTVSKDMIAFFAAMQKKADEKTSGRQKLKKLLQSGSELKVFTIKGRDKFRIFADNAKKWGVVYSVVRRESKDRKDEIYEVLVKAEDAAKLNRMIEKYGLMNDVSISVEREPEKQNEKSDVMKAREVVDRMMQPTIMDRLEEDESVPGGRAAERENLFAAESMHFDLDESDGIKRYEGLPPWERPSIKDEIKRIIRIAKTNKQNKDLGKDVLKSVINHGREES